MQKKKTSPEPLEYIYQGQDRRREKKTSEQWFSLKHENNINSESSNGIWNRKVTTTTITTTEEVEEMNMKEKKNWEHTNENQMKMNYN